MIISHRHQLIFIKTMKTAGTSIEILLSQHCGPEDVITPLLPEDEWLRRSLGGRPSQNCWVPLGEIGARDVLLTGRRALGAVGARVRRREEVHQIRPAAVRNHAPARKVRAMVGRDVWDRYRTVCVERDPWERSVSFYYHHLALGTIDCGLDEWVASDDLLRSANAPIYELDGEVLVDVVLRYEDLATELDRVLDEVGLPTGAALPRAKGGFRPERTEARSALSAASVDRIGRVFAADVERFGYQPPAR